MRTHTHYALLDIEHRNLLYYPSCKIGPCEMALRLVKIALFAAAAAMIVPVAFLTAVLQHRAERHRIYRR